ncbi:RTA1-domain-containing protein [Daedaleopsis nitida]|nr:RTA1-domain-containing protein [Daedaleopsis nitida]
MASVDATSSTGRDPASIVRSRVSPYGYIPTEWVCIFMVVVFAISSVLHLAQTIKSRLWWLLGTATLAGLLEVLGWSGRLWNSKNPRDITPFMIQIIATIIAPTPLIAANFIILGEIIRRLGQQFSRLQAKWYTIIFLCCDVIALFVQAAGGAKASIAVQNNKNAQPGGHIMLGGIVFQLIAFCTYLFLAAEFLLRYHYDKPFSRAGVASSRKRCTLDRGVKFMIGGLALDALWILIRSVYRTVELADGWLGRIIATETYFNVLDGLMIVFAMFTLNVFHPGFLLGKAKTWNRSAYDSAVELDDMKEGVSKSVSD